MIEVSESFLDAPDHTRVFSFWGIWMCIAPDRRLRELSIENPWPFRSELTMRLRRRNGCCRYNEDLEY